MDTHDTFDIMFSSKTNTVMSTENVRSHTYMTSDFYWQILAKQILNKNMYSICVCMLLKDMLDLNPVARQNTDSVTSVKFKPTFILSNICTLATQQNKVLQIK